MEADDFEMDDDVTFESDDFDQFDDHDERFDNPHEFEAEAEEHDADADAANRRDHRRALRIYGSVTVLFAASIAALGLFGYKRSIDMTGGINPEAAALDRDQPGYEATVKATPVTLLVVTEADGKLGSIGVAAPRPEEDGGGGTMMVLPLPTLVQRADKSSDTFPSAFAKGGIEQLRVDVETVIGFGVSSTIVLDPSQLANVLQRGIPIVNPDTIYVSTPTGDRTIAFDSGPITVPADRAAEYLGLLGDGENAVNRNNRAELFWSAVLTGKRTSDNAAGEGLMPGAVVPATSAPTAGTGSSGPSGASASSGAVAPGDASGASGTSTTSASGSSGSSGSTGAATSDTSAAVNKATALLADLEKSTSTVFGAPTEEIPLGLPDGTTLTTFKVVQSELNQRLADFVPIPSSAFDGQRSTVLLLNGTTKLDQQLQYIDKIVGAGATITAVGNAARLDVKTSTVVYFDDAAKAGADKVAAALGLNATRSKDTRKFDVVVTIGSDLMS